MIYDESTIAFEPELIRIRRQLHANPELRFEEQQTSDYVASLLAEWDIPVVRGIRGHGLVGVLRHGKSNRSVGLRADMDALPMQEANTFAHASRHAGRCMRAVMMDTRPCCSEQRGICRSIAISTAS